MVKPYLFARTNCQAPTITRLTHSPYPTKIARIRRCFTLSAKDELQTISAYIKYHLVVSHPLCVYFPPPPGFHLSATVFSTQGGQSKGAYNVAVMFDRCRITSCSCTCGAGAKWCAHVVALCLFRIHNVSTAECVCGWGVRLKM